jgi:hypothetical protein
MKKFDLFVSNLMLAILVLAGAEYAYATLPPPKQCSPTNPNTTCQGGCNGYWHYYVNEGGCLLDTPDPSPAQACLNGTAGCADCACKRMGTTGANCTCKK